MWGKVFNFYNLTRRSLKNSVFFALYILSRPNLLKVAFKGVYLPQYIQFEWCKIFKISTFIDIGANEGNVSNAINYISPNTAIFAFEPLKQKGRLIRSKIKSKNLTVEPLALSDRSGTQTFYEYGLDVASSFLKPDPKTFRKNMHVAKSYPVKITTLDQYFRNKKLKKPIFVKMDVEGTEDLIIKGGQKTLMDVSFIVIETSFIKIRPNQCQFDKIYNQLTKLGFVYKGSMFDSFFYPFFGANTNENSVFIRKGELLNYLDEYDKVWNKR